MFSSPRSNPRSRSGLYRSNRAVRRQRDDAVHRWSKTKWALMFLGVLVLGMTTILPVIVLETAPTKHSSNYKAPVSLHNLIGKSLEVEADYKRKSASLRSHRAAKEDGLNVKVPAGEVAEHSNNSNLGKVVKPKEEEHPKVDDIRKPVEYDPANELEDPGEGLALDMAESTYKAKKQQLARGVSGLPMAETPALIGARPGHIECDVDVDDVAYWNSPQGARDQELVSPFATPKDHYLTFEPDRGGWNNIRMSMEIIFVLAAATGRTLVLPPKAPFYLLGRGEENARSFGSFFPLDDQTFQDKVKVITMSEFLAREKNGILDLSDKQVTKFEPVADLCLHQSDSPVSCEPLYEHLRDVGFQPELEGMKNCMVFDLERFQGKPVSKDVEERVARFCGEKRKPVYYDDEMHLPQLIHWNANEREHRLLNHFYAFHYFTDPVIDNFYKRFVRDFLHYRDPIYCAAGKIVHALNQEGRPWSSLHVRRGDLQYKAVKISAEEWYENTKEVWQEGETLFIATDERNKTFFDPIKEHHDVRFLDDYWDMAKLGDLDSTYLGMIDTIVASHGRAFAGTWFSTFTGYINRMRGYLGHPMHNSWYSFLSRKDVMQEWTYPTGNIPAREWPIGWTAIDGDKWIEHEGTPVVEEENSKASPPDRKKLSEIVLSDLSTDEAFVDKPVSRGVAGRPLSDTPAMVGAKRAHIECEINVDSVAYWNDPQGQSDESFTSPFKVLDEEKYISFSVDRGGWNNVRMGMEIIFVIAAATGRTVVLPPKEPLYRLRADTDNVHRGFGDFFPLHTANFAKRVKTISMKEFIDREGGPNGRAPIPPEMMENVTSSAVTCDKRKNSKSYCGHIADYLADVGHNPEIRPQEGCLVFDKDVYEGGKATEDNEKSIAHFCGERTPMYWTSELQEHDLIHFHGAEKKFRLLAHYYGLIHFTDLSIDNYHKRFVRDFLHYHDSIYCAAGKIIKSLQLEGRQRGFQEDEEGGGGYSALHIRRGDFQYKRVKIPAEEWYENTIEVWKPNEILYIATDERNKTFFDPIAEHHELRFLDDYFDFAKLGDLDPNYFGMIDTIVASRGRAFAGTWFSTFTGYINRMRGYHGMSMKDSWYSFLERKTKMHTWEHMDSFAYAYEWPVGWIGIDGDVEPSKAVF